MSVGIIKQTLRTFPTIERVKIGAPGEALVSAKFPEVVSQVIKMGRKAAVGTNGTLITKVGDKVPWSKVAAVNISISDPNPTKYKAVTGTALIEKVEEGIDFLHSKGTRCLLSFVITKNNINRIPDFLRFAKKKRAHKVIFQSLCGNHDVTDPSSKELQTFWNNLALVRGDTEIIKRIREIKRKTKHIFPRMVLWPRLLERNSVGFGCNMAKTYIAVDGNGDVALCCGGPGPRGEMGNIHQGFNVWNTGPMKELRHSVFAKKIKDKPTKCLVCRVNYRSRV
jgi:radical SAM protein with 4Fe4S-binding SPASM domain